MGLETPGHVDEAIAAMGEGRDGMFLVEGMGEDVVAELLVNVRREWPVGWLVTLGAGGVLAELMDDHVRLLAPVEPWEVAEALGRLRIGRLLAGYRGARPAELDACVDTVCSLVNGALGDGDVRETEVNPLMATTTGAVAADCLMSLAG